MALCISISITTLCRFLHSAHKRKKEGIWTPWMHLSTFFLRSATICSVDEMWHECTRCRSSFLSLCQPQSNCLRTRPSRSLHTIHFHEFSLSLHFHSAVRHVCECVRFAWAWLSVHVVFSSLFFFWSHALQQKWTAKISASDKAMAQLCTQTRCTWCITILQSMLLLLCFFVIPDHIWLWACHMWNVESGLDSNKSYQTHCTSMLLFGLLSIILEKKSATSTQRLPFLFCEIDSFFFVVVGKNVINYVRRMPAPIIIIALSFVLFYFHAWWMRCRVLRMRQCGKMGRHSSPRWW